eukprot:SM000079S22476  [mRNA]  locus=s79:436576:438008:+ [translate_table: standard]
MEAAVPLALGSASALSAALRPARPAPPATRRAAGAGPPLRLRCESTSRARRLAVMAASSQQGGSPGGLHRRRRSSGRSPWSRSAEISKTSGRYAKTTNLVIGGVETPAADWKQLDEKVNQYPMARGFTAIGEGGDDFVASMVVAVETVLQTPVGGKVRQRESAQGRYISVKIGPMRVESSEQVQAVYRAMRSDRRMRYFL